jgi:hypothetical protein
VKHQRENVYGLDIQVRLHRDDFVESKLIDFPVSRTGDKLTPLRDAKFKRPSECKLRRPLALKHSEDYYLLSKSGQEIVCCSRSFYSVSEGSRIKICMQRAEKVRSVKIKFIYSHLSNRTFWIRPKVL